MKRDRSKQMEIIVDDSGMPLMTEIWRVEDAVLQLDEIDKTLMAFHLIDSLKNPDHVLFAIQSRCKHCGEPIWEEKTCNCTRDE